MLGGPSAPQWENNEVCDGRCNTVYEGVGVVRIHDGLLTKQSSLTVQMRYQILLLNMVSIALYVYHL